MDSESMQEYREEHENTAVGLSDSNALVSSLDVLRDKFEKLASVDGKYPRAIERTGDIYHLMQTQNDWEAWKQCAKAISNFDFFFPVLDRLQDRLEDGATISFQDGRWWIFTKEGEGVCSGENIRGMLTSLIFTDC